MAKYQPGTRVSLETSPDTSGRAVECNTGGANVLRGQCILFKQQAKAFPNYSDKQLSSRRTPRRDSVVCDPLHRVASPLEDPTMALPHLASLRQCPARPGLAVGCCSCGIPPLTAAELL